MLVLEVGFSFCFIWICLSGFRFELGRPFLKLVDAVLDAGEGKVTMNLNGTKYTYNFLRASKHLTPFSSRR
jgi:hypothetical protein